MTPEDSFIDSLEWTLAAVGPNKAKRQWLEDKMTKNADKPFVKRFMQPEAERKTVPAPDGKKSTHSMAHEVDEKGRWSAFPTVEDYGEGLKRYELREAQRLARQHGNEIFFDNQQDAAFFPKNYKKLWK